MGDNETFEEVWADNTPLENCVFPERRTPIFSDLYNPRWVGACCDFTAMLLTMKASFFKKECSKNIECVVTLKDEAP
tara:strand:- start:46 stop:276 length:231 start_codon:yes stop_codon:yes gene_type:complete